jgi:hypothetical protein
LISVWAASRFGEIEGSTEVEGEDAEVDGEGEDREGEGTKEARERAWELPCGSIGDARITITSSRKMHYEAGSCAQSSAGLL